MRVVDYRDWPKPTLFRDIGLVAYVDECDLDAIATLLSAKPKTFTQRATKTEPQICYRSIFLVLSNRAPAALTEDLHKPGRIEVSLQVVRDEFAYDDDFAEVIAALKVDAGKVRKFEGNFTWLPNRKAKKVTPPDEPPPDNW